jgi:RNA polymerase sigma-70 factor (ECF subfamily)
MTTAPLTTDADLLARLRTGDDHAFEDFVRQFSGRLLHVARGLLRNDEDAADAVQDAFVSAFKSLERFEANSSLGTWMHRIVVNMCLMKLRSRRTRKTRSIEELLPRFDETGHHVQPVCPWSESGYQRLASTESRNQVRACIDQLPDDYRTILILRDVEELETDVTAGILGISVGAAKTRLHRARQALRTLLAPLFEEPAGS